MGNSQAFTSNKTADALIYTGSGEFKGFVIQPDGTNDVTITFYDNTSATGTKLVCTMTFDGAGGPQALQLPVAVPFFNGIYADVTTNGTVEYTVLWGR